MIRPQFSHLLYGDYPVFDNDLRTFRLIPVVVIDNQEDAAPLADAVIDGGLRCVEVTLRTETGLTAIAAMAARSDLVVGAGTVLSIDQARAAVDNGARFIVSPGLSVTLVEWCLKHDIPVFPGCATPTEIQLALECGLSTVKFFPAEQLGGVKMLTTLGNVFHQAGFMPTGGISRNNLADYLALEQVVACGGSWMVQPQWLAGKDFTRIREEIAAACGMLQQHPA